MALLDDIKISLRVGTAALDGEIGDLIDAVKTELILSGILSAKVDDESDALIKRAVTLYCKANFGYNNPDAEKLQRSYDLLKSHLALSAEYTVAETEV